MGSNNKDSFDPESSSENTAQEESKAAPLKDKKTSPANDAIQKIASQNETISKAQQTAEKIKRTAEKVKIAATAIKTSALALAKILLNPVTWVIIIVVILGIYVYSIPQVIGQNDNAKGCEAYGGGSSSTLVQNSEDKVKRMNSVAAYLAATPFKFNDNKPLNTNQIAAIIGNMDHESSVDSAVSQSGFLPKTATNAEAKSAVSSKKSGTALGLVQWDGGRRDNLIAFAEGKGKLWSDLGTQLDYLKHEFDSAEGTNLKKNGFNDDSKTLEELVVIFNKYYERSGDSNESNPNHESVKEKRINGAKSFLTTYNGGSYVSTTGGSCLVASTGVDMSDSVSLAISLSYATEAESRVGSGDSYGQSKAKEEYRVAKKAAMEIKPDALANLYASCDRFVATVMILTKDPKFAWGSTDGQRSYMTNSPLWEKYTDFSQRKPGDIWITDGSKAGGNGHIVIYLGVIDGKESIAHASYLSRVAGIGDYMANQIINNGRDSLGRGYWGFRFVG